MKHHHLLKWLSYCTLRSYVKTAFHSSIWDALVCKNYNYILLQGVSHIFHFWIRCFVMIIVYFLHCFMLAGWINFSGWQSVYRYRIKKMQNLRSVLFSTLKSKSADRIQMMPQQLNDIQLHPWLRFPFSLDTLFKICRIDHKGVEPSEITESFQVMRMYKKNKNKT